MIKKPKKNTQTMMTSRFWLNQDFIDKFSEKGSGKDAVALAGYKRAVGNFVRIVTGENIPVRFSNGNQSYTDGKVVTISTSADPKDFDSNVGLALHEGSHIKLTDFELLKGINDFIQKDDDFMLVYAEKHGIDRWDAAYKIAPKLKDILNVVEDRRIDNFVYTTAPGYRGYYNALYDKYFNHKIIDKGLQSSELRTEDWESYMFRLINITNPNRDMTALKGLAQIWETMDLANIGRLKNTSDALQVAWDIFKIIESNVPVAKQQEEEEPGTGEGGAPGEGGKGPKGEMKNPEGDGEDDGEGASGDDSKDTGDDDYEGNSKGKTSENDEDEDEGQEVNEDEGDDYGDDEPDDNFDQLTPREIQQLEKAQQAQKEFLNQRIKKKKSNKALDRTVEALDAGDVDSKEVKYGDDGNLRKVNVTVVRNVTARMIKDVDCCMWYRYSTNKGPSHNAVTEGLILGQMLGKRLKVRSESKNTVFNRLRTGKIDKRMISSAGFGHEAIFQKLETFSYTPSIIHISIDNSGSMGGQKLHNAVKTATAIAKACSMIENMDCVISYRCDGRFAGSPDKPLMVIAYDSRKHKLVQFTQVVQFIGTGGTTPEGLCFDAVMDEILKDARGKDAYFLNFSDGEPYSGSYEGRVAHEHTRKQVQKMITNGIKVISYFIGHAGANSSNNFRTMYGKDASFIDVSSVTEVSKTMNKKFLELA